MLGKLQQHAPSCRAACRMLQWSAAWRTSDAIVSDCDMISKIRARQSTRNDELYTRQAADRSAPAPREQEVSGRKGGTVCKSPWPERNLVRE